MKQILTMTAKGKTVPRFLPAILVGALSASAAFAAGVAIDLPAIVEFAFVACLALFFAAVLAGTTDSAVKDADRDAAATGGAIVRLDDKVDATHD